MGDEEGPESWKPKGQADLMEQNYYAQIRAKKNTKANDDLLGETVISAIGLEDQTIKKNKDWEFDLELVQTQASEDDGKAPETFFLQQQRRMRKITFAAGVLRGSKSAHLTTTRLTRRSQRRQRSTYLIGIRTTTVSTTSSLLPNSPPPGEQMRWTESVPSMPTSSTLATCSTKQKQARAPVH